MTMTGYLASEADLFASRNPPRCLSKLALSTFDLSFDLPFANVNFW